MSRSFPTVTSHGHVTVTQETLAGNCRVLQPLPLLETASHCHFSILITLEKQTFYSVHRIFKDLFLTLLDHHSPFSLWLSLLILLRCLLEMIPSWGSSVLASQHDFPFLPPQSCAGNCPLWDGFLMRRSKLQVGFLFLLVPGVRTQESSVTSAGSLICLCCFSHCQWETVPDSQ